MKYLEFVSIIASLSTLVGFISIFIKMGREKGAQEVTIKDIRKDIDSNALNIRNLENKTNTMQVENARLVSTLSSDLGWIKSSLADIKAEIKKGEK